VYRPAIRLSIRPARSSFGLSLPAVALALVAIPAQTHAQSDLSVGPFLSYFPSVSTSPLAGLALTLANGPVGFRASGQVSLNRSPLGSSSNVTTPWGADADVLLMLGSNTPLRRTLAPFVFAGLGTTTTDTGMVRAYEKGWSYGAGLLVPLGSALELFGETRYRMSSYVLPTASLAPSPRHELRFGLTFRVGGSSARRSTDRISVLPAGIPSGGGRTTASASAARVLNTADRYVGVKYVYGGTSPTSGFDCSGFVQYVFAKHGVQLPRTSRQQATVGTRLPADWSAVSAGDLVMFEEGGRIGHVAIYVGRDRIIHATSSGGAVRYDDLTTQRGQWFVEHMVAARRVTPDARGLLLDLAKGFATGIALELDGPDHAPRAR
jgi:hypothetical protein